MERLVDQRETSDLRAVGHGQVLRYTADRPVETARNGITRVGPHSRYGFGELRVYPLASDSINPLRAVERHHGMEA